MKVKTMSRRRESEGWVCHDVSYDSDSNVCSKIVSAMSTNEDIGTTDVLSEADISILDAFSPCLDKLWVKV